MTIREILEEAVRRSASDVLIIAGMPAAYKINGLIRREGERLLPPDTQALAEELYHMAGERSMSALLEQGDRRLTGPTMPPQGLYMNRLWYEGAVGEMMMK